MNDRSRKIAFGCYFISILAWTLLYLLLNNKSDWDLWGVMSFGAWLDQNGRFPYQDPFSYTAYLKPWVYHEWGSGVVFYQLFKAWGSTSLFWLKLALTTSLWLLACWPVIPRQKNQTRIILPFFALHLLASAYLLLPTVSITLRCHLFSFVFYALFLLILQRNQNRPSWKMLCLLPGIMLVWANLHGGFITGLVAIAAFTLQALLPNRAGNGNRPGLALLLTLVASGLVVLINPYGLRFVQTMLEAWALPRGGISEWGNVFTANIPYYGLLYSGMLIFWLVLAARQARQSTLPAVLLIALTGINGWLHYKLAPLFLMTALSLGYQLVPSWWLERWEQFKPEKNSLQWRLAGMLGRFALPALLTGLALVPVGLYLAKTPKPFHVRVQGDDTLQARKAQTRFAYPIGAIDYLRQANLTGNLWTPFAWGEYAYWSLYPRFRVSIDGRYETIYPLSVYEDTEAFYHPPFPLDKADLYPTTHILLSTQTPEQVAQLIYKMDHSPNWRLIYADNLARLYARTERNEWTDHKQPPLTPARPNQSRLLDDYPAGKRFRLHSE